jgi:hypothetical protein
MGVALGCMMWLSLKIFKGGSFVGDETQQAAKNHSLSRKFPFAPLNRFQSPLLATKGHFSVNTFPFFFFASSTLFSFFP